jgi:hypothetical protein
MKLTLSTIPESGVLEASTTPNGFGADHGDRGSASLFRRQLVPPARQDQMAVLHLSFDDIRGTNEFSREGVPRLEINLARCGALGDRAHLHDDDPVTEFDGLRLIVRHTDRGSAGRAVTGRVRRAADREVRPRARSRLVEQQGASPYRSRARDAAGPCGPPAKLGSIYLAAANASFATRQVCVTAALTGSLQTLGPFAA